MTTADNNDLDASIIILDDVTQAKLDLWKRMAKAIIRAYTKLPEAKHNEALNKELAELTLRARELEPSLKSYFPLD
jgi:hypothetical protein